MAEEPTANDSGSKELSAAKLTAWTFIARVMGILTRLARNILLARILGPFERGVLNAIVAVIELTVLIVGFGLPTSTAYHAARDEFRRTLLPTLAILTTGIGFLISVIIYVLCIFPALWKDFPEIVETYALVAAVTSLFIFIRLILHHYLIGFGRVVMSNWLRIFESAAPLVLFVIFILFWRDDLVAAITSWAVAYALVALLSIAIVWNTKQDGRRPDRDIGKSLVNFGLRSYLGNVFQVLVFRSDILLISILIGADAVAFYAVAVVGAELLLIFSETGTTVATRALLRGDSDKTKAANPIVTQNIARWTLYLMVVAGSALAVTRDFWLWLAFGSEFLPASGALLWLIPGMLALSLSGFVRLDLTGRGRPGWISAILGVFAFVNLALNLMLIPVWNIEGAAIASTITYIGMSITFCIMFKYETRVDLTKFLFNYGEDTKALQAVVAYFKHRLGKKPGASET